MCILKAMSLVRRVVVVVVVGSGFCLKFREREREKRIFLCGVYYTVERRANVCWRRERLPLIDESMIKDNLSFLINRHLHNNDCTHTTNYGCTVA